MAEITAATGKGSAFHAAAFVGDDGPPRPARPHINGIEGL